jgi:release factor glutamine methyltransferase
LILPVKGKAGATPLTIVELRRHVTQKLTPISESASFDAQILVAQAAGVTRSWILSHPEASLSPRQQEWLDSALDKLIHGQPLPYVLGKWDFFGLTYFVTPAVLIPRPETELLVEHALAWCRRRSLEGVKSLRCADIGTGTGCIAISLLANLPAEDLIRTLVASDISWEALQIARQNAAQHGVYERISWLHADLISAFLPGSLDLICANLPYIPKVSLQLLAVARHEPKLALNGGSDGLDKIRRFLEQASYCLNPGGLLLAEIETSQGKEVLKLAHTCFQEAAIDLIQDLAGNDRLLRIRKRQQVDILL